MSQVTFRYTMAGIPALQNDVCALDAHEGQNEISRTDSLLEAIFQDLKNKTADKILRCLEFKRHLLRNFEDITSSIEHMTRVMDVVLEKKDFTALVETIVKRVTKKAVNMELKRETKRRKFVEAA